MGTVVVGLVFLGIIFFIINAVAKHGEDKEKELKVEYSRGFCEALDSIKDDIYKEYPHEDDCPEDIKQFFIKYVVPNDIYKRVGGKTPSWLQAMERGD